MIDDLICDPKFTFSRANEPVPPQEIGVWNQLSLPSGAMLVELSNGVQYAVGNGLSDAERDHPPPARYCRHFSLPGVLGCWRAQGTHVHRHPSVSIAVMLSLQESVEW